MMQPVQLTIADAVYASALRDALSRSGPWHVETLPCPDISQRSVFVLDEEAFLRLPLPLLYPERVVLITRKDPQLFAQAWDAGIVSVVSIDDPLSTVLLAIMAAALRVAKFRPAASGGISPVSSPAPAQFPPEGGHFSTKRSKNQ